MKKKHSYRTVDVEKIDWAKLLAVVVTGYVLAIDVAKTKFVAAIADAQGNVLQLFRFAHPKQTLALIELIRRLAERQAVQVVMEPTGIYGDVVRHQCDKAGCKVFMVRPKFTHDFGELQDGVPSMHDGKAACVLAQLHALGKSTRWQASSEQVRELRALVDERRAYSRLLQPAQGQLEALMSRWWPEFEDVMDIYHSKTARKIILEYPSAGDVVNNESEVRELMRTKGRGRLRAETRDRVIASARANLSQEPIAQEKELIRCVVKQVDELTDRIADVDKRLHPMVESDETINLIAQVIGVGTAASLVALVGNPLEFESARAYEKALGLNLKVRSSGEKSGQLAITKRGNGPCRQLMFFAALRLIKSSEVARAWYQNRKSFAAGQKKKAVVAVMRKLIKAIWHVARGESFDPNKLFDTRRLNLTIVSEPQAA